MPDTQEAQSPALTDLLQQAVTEISPETQQALLNHPDTPGVIDRIKTAIGLGHKQDVMSPQEQSQAKAEGVPTMAHPENGGDTAEDAARKQAVLDIANTAAGTTKATASNATPAHDSFIKTLEGVGTLLIGQLKGGYEGARKEMEAKTAVKEPK